MAHKEAEGAMVSSFNETENEEKIEEKKEMFSFKSFLWHGGSVYDAWFSCASNQVLWIFIEHEKIKTSKKGKEKKN